MMQHSHKQMVALAERQKLGDEKRGILEEMRKEVFRSIASGLKKLKNDKNPWKLSRSSEFRTGSLYRRTALKDSTDIDVILLLNFKPRENNDTMPRAKDVLLLISSLVPKTYDVLLNKRSVQVKKKTRTHGQLLNWHSQIFGTNGEIFMDIVPALQRVGDDSKPSTWWYGISKVSGPAQWLKFNPKHQRAMFKKLSKRKGQIDDSTVLIICLKHWKNMFRNPPCKLPSYVLEVLVWRDYKLHPGRVTDLTVRFNRVLKSFKNIIHQGIRFDEMLGGAHKPSGKKVARGSPLLHDPSNTSQNLVKHMRMADLEWWSAKALEAASPNLRFETIFRSR